MDKPLNELGRWKEAIDSYDKALGLKPNDAGGFYHRCLVHFRLKQFTDSIRDFRRTLEINPEYKCAPGLLVFSKLCCCDWPGVEEEQAKDNVADNLRRRAQAGGVETERLIFAPFMDSQEDYCAVRSGESLRRHASHNAHAMRCGLDCRC